MGLNLQKTMLPGTIKNPKGEISYQLQILNTTQKLVDHSFYQLLSMLAQE